MSPSTFYVPIVKGKAGDLAAIGTVSSVTRQQIKPLFELLPVARKRPSAEQNVFDFCSLVQKHVPLGDAFVDFYGLTGDEMTADGSNAVLRGFELLKAFGRAVTPTFGFERNDDLWGPLGIVARDFGKGFCFRLGRDEISVAQRNDTWASIIEISAEMGLGASQVDILIDLRSVTAAEATSLPELLVSFLFENPGVGEYRSLIVAGSSALDSVSDVAEEGMLEVRRQELHVWSTLWLDMPDGIKPTYGDYGVVHPDFSDQGANPNINAKIRYTAANKIVYFRGHRLLKPIVDFSQYHDLAARVVRAGLHKRRDESFGDAYLSDCANRLIKPGTPRSWVQADMNHHVTYTARQIARFVDQFAVAQDDAAALRALTTA